MHKIVMGQIFSHYSSFGIIDVSYINSNSITEAVSYFKMPYLSRVAARIYFPFGENLTKDTGGLSSSENKDT